MGPGCGGNGGLSRRGLGGRRAVGPGAAGIEPGGNPARRTSGSQSGGTPRAQQSELGEPNPQHRKPVDQSFADTGNNFDAAIISTPRFTGSFTSGAEPVLGLGATGQTVISLQSSVVPALNSAIALPITDPLSPLFAALLPLNF